MQPGLHPELSSAAKMPRVTRRTAPLFRLLGKLPMPFAKTEGVEVFDRSDGNVQVRVFRPKDGKPTGALLWMHGGGLIIGSPRQDDGKCADFARELGILVVAPYYRLAPKHRFPAAIDDCLAAWNWLQEHAEEYGIDPGRVVIGGESAGGGLAASLAQRVHDEGGVQPIAQLLVYPMLDDRTAAVRELDAVNHLVWNNESNHLGWSSYLGVEPGTLDVPEYAVPSRRRELSGLPACWIGVGSLDLFLEECRDYARRLGEAGVECTIEVAEGGCHGFIAVAPSASISRVATASQIEFLRQRLQASR